MELRHLRYFLAVAEEQNFRRAAERLGMAQPPLSSQIRDLENEIGVSLFRRVPKGAELTDAGKAFFAAVPAVFKTVNEAVQRAQRADRGETGQLKVGYTGSASFNQIVTRSILAFRSAYPSIGLTLEESNTPQLLDSLNRQTLDAVFIRQGEAPLPGFAVTLLDEEPMLVAAPASHRLAERCAVALSELKDEPFVMFSRALGPALYGEVIRSCRDAGFDPIVSQVAPQVTSIANLVAAEFGISIVPAHTAKVHVGGVVFIPIAGPAPVARLSLATRANDHSVVTRNFLSMSHSLAKR